LIRNQRLSRWVGWAAPLLAFGAAVSGADDVAKMVPADVPVYIQIDGLSEVHADAEKDPLIKFIREQAPKPAGGNPWEQLQTLMGMSGQEIVDHYFGRSVGVAVQRTGPGAPGVLLSKVNKEDAALAVERLKLVKSGQAGGFTIYNTSDEHGRIAFGDGWMALGDANAAAFMNTLLDQAGKGKSLADDAQFKAWTAKLPAEHAALLVAHDPQTHGHHAAAAVRSGRDYVIHYVGESDDFAPIFAKLGSAKATDFGPLPASTIFAVTLNVRESNAEGRPFPVLDQMLAPKTFSADVLGKTDAPLVLFVGEVGGDGFDPNPGFSVPTVGVMIHLKDPRVAGDIDKMIGNAVAVAGFAAAGKVDPFGTVAVGEGDAAYHVVDLGAAIAKVTGHAELGKLGRITYGRVGEFYIVCTQENFFQKCRATRAGSLKLGDTPDVKAAKLQEAESPVAAAVMRAPLLAAHLKTWLDYARKTRPELVEAAKADEPASGEAKAVKGVTLLQGLLEFYGTSTLQVRRDGEMVRAELRLNRR
jgi:hypothetical protein